MGQTHVTGLQGKILVATTDPSDPQTGDLYFNSTEGNLNYYNGTGWITIEYTSTSSSSTSSSTTSTSSSTTTSTTTSTSSSTTSTSTTL